jgi:uncharacterized Zn-finger protein
MAQEFYIKCPFCSHVYNAGKMIYDRGEDFMQFCPMCMKKYPRKEGEIVSANFPVVK